MIKIILSILLISSIKADSNLDKEWQSWKLKYDNPINGRSKLKNEQQRFKTFSINYKKIKEHNLHYDMNQTSYKLSLNEYSDRTESELFDIFNKDLNSKQIRLPKKSTGKLPVFKQTKQTIETVNWATSGYLAPVPSQGPRCGSCYAFAAVKVL